MKNIKNIVIGIFAVIGFGAIVTGFTNETEQTPTFGTPESHVWEAAITLGAGSTSSRLFLYNKVTGEVRKYNRTYPSYKYENWRDNGTEFVVMKDVNTLELKQK